MIKIEYHGFHEKSTKFLWKGNAGETVIVWIYLPEPQKTKMRIGNERNRMYSYYDEIVF